MPTSEFQCPFCQQTSPRPQGLAAHIRNRHQKQYPKWLKTPSRLADAQAGVPKGTPAPDAEPQVPAPPEIQEVHSGSAVPSPPRPNPALDLLKKAHAELIGRKQTIETELAHLADLTKELETVKAQIEALDKALGVFEA